MSKPAARPSASASRMPLRLGTARPRSMEARMAKLERRIEALVRRLDRDLKGLEEPERLPVAIDPHLGAN